MLQRAGHLQIACELRHAPQRLAAVRTSEPMLGVSSWTTVNLKTDRTGAEEALCLWLNSTPGILLRVCHANRPYLGRSRLPHELMRTLPVLNVETLEEKQLQTRQRPVLRAEGQEPGRIRRAGQRPGTTGTRPTATCRRARPRRAGHDRQASDSAEQRANDDGQALSAINASIDHFEDITSLTTVAGPLHRVVSAACLSRSNPIHAHSGGLGWHGGNSCSAIR